MQVIGLVARYYGVQKPRVAAGNRLQKDEKKGKPHDIPTFFWHNLYKMEDNLRYAFAAFVKEYRVGRCLLDWHGVGPVIAAGLTATLDVRRAPTSGNFYSFAGLNPAVHQQTDTKIKSLLSDELASGFTDATIVTEDQFATICGRLGRKPQLVRNLFAFLAKTKTSPKTIKVGALKKVLMLRPWSQFVKTLVVGKAVPCFLKCGSSDKDVYAKLWYMRRDKEWLANLRGEFAGQAQAALSEKSFSHATQAHLWYSGRVSLKAAEIWVANNKAGMPMEENAVKPDKEGCGPQMLPPGRIRSRATRFVGKIFLSHVHMVMYKDFYGTEPPLPYVLTKFPEHTHLINPPSWPDAFKGKSLRELLEGK